MDTLYASTKHDIILAIERSAVTTYAKIDFRKADSVGLCLKRYVNIYRQLLSELNFIPFKEESSIILFVCQDKETSVFSNLSQLKRTLDERIMTLEREEKGNLLTKL